MGRIRFLCGVFTPEKLHHAELFVCEGEYDHFAFGRKEILYSSDMNIRIFATIAMTCVNGKLHHAEAVFLEIFPETGCMLPVLFGFGRQIKKYKYPQNPVFI